MGLIINGIITKTPRRIDRRNSSQIEGLSRRKMPELYDNEISNDLKKAFWEKVVDSDNVDVNEVVKQCCSVDGIPIIGTVG